MPNLSLIQRILILIFFNVSFFKNQFTQNWTYRLSKTVFIGHLSEGFSNRSWLDNANSQSNLHFVAIGQSDTELIASISKPIWVVRVDETSYKNAVKITDKLYFSANRTSKMIFPNSKLLLGNAEKFISSEINNLP